MLPVYFRDLLEPVWKTFRFRACLMKQLSGWKLPGSLLLQLGRMLRLLQQSTEATLKLQNWFFPISLRLAGMVSALARRARVDGAGGDGARRDLVGPPACVEYDLADRHVGAPDQDGNTKPEQTLG